MPHTQACCKTAIGEQRCEIAYLFNTAEHIYRTIGDTNHLFNKRSLVKQRIVSDTLVEIAQAARLSVHLIIRDICQRESDRTIWYLAHSLKTVTEQKFTVADLHLHHSYPCAMP